MPNCKTSSHIRSLLKGISWRIVATTDTILVVLLVTCLFSECSLENAIKIGASEFLIKLVIYYIHERTWLRILKKQATTSKEILYKTISWRVIATTTTFIISGIVLDAFNEIALYIALIELFTKFALYYVHEKLWLKLPLGRIRHFFFGKNNNMSKHIILHNYQVSKKTRIASNNHNSLLIWFTGLSGSGKSTIANLVEKALSDLDIKTYSLDGDNIRNGINNDLSFTPEDRTENIRRIAEVSNLMIDAGLVVLAAFVSPYKKDRDNVKSIVKDVNFVEIYINTSIEECERRDVKGLYKKARAGEIKNMTGISAPYEAPKKPEIEINTEFESVEDAVKRIIDYIIPKLKIKNE